MNNRATQGTGQIADEHEKTDSMKDADEEEGGHAAMDATTEDAEEDAEEAAAS